MTVVDAATVVGSIAGILALALTGYTFIRSRGRLKINASFTDDKSVNNSDSCKLDSLFIQALNVGHEDIILTSFSQEVRPTLPSVLRSGNIVEFMLRSGYITIEFIKEADWVTIQPGRRHTIIIPFNPGGSLIVTEIGAVTSLGRRYKLSLRNLFRLRAVQYSAMRKRNRMAPGMSN
jgi:hypothetical protein